MKDDLLLEDASFEVMPEIGRVGGRRPMRVAGIPPTGRNKVPPADRIKAANLASFDFDRSNLKPHHGPEIERVAAQIAESWRVGRPFFTVYVVGHTDSEGRYQHNMALGLRRALAVRRELTEALKRQGGNLAYKVLILAQSKGPSELFDRSRTPEGQARNRRAEVFLSTKALKAFPKPPPPLPPVDDTPPTKPPAECRFPRCDPSVPTTVWAACGLNKYRVPYDCVPVPGEKCGICEGASRSAERCLDENERRFQSERKKCFDELKRDFLYTYVPKCGKNALKCVFLRNWKDCLKTLGCAVYPEPHIKQQKCLRNASERVIKEGKRCRALP